jgi:hypothetical protein
VIFLDLLSQCLPFLTLLHILHSARRFWSVAAETYVFQNLAMLSRRSSSSTTSLLRKRPSFLLKLKGDKSLDKPSLFPSPRVPIEILDTIIEFFIESTASSPDSKFCASYAYIVALTLVSIDFRQLALRHYFRNLMLLSRRHWAGLFNFLTSEHQRNQLRRWSGDFTWVKCVYASLSFFKTGIEAHISGHSALPLQFSPTNLNALADYLTCTHYPSISAAKAW